MGCEVDLLSFRTRTAITSRRIREIIVSERTARLMQARLPGKRMSMSCLSAN